MVKEGQQRLNRLSNEISQVSSKLLLSLDNLLNSTNSELSEGHEESEVLSEDFLKKRNFKLFIKNQQPRKFAQIEVA